jgi:hypothetical protein
VAITLKPRLRATASVWSKADQSRTPSVVASDWKNQERNALLPGPIAASDSSRAGPVDIAGPQSPSLFAL